jgi:hypothetical protein
LFRLSPKVGGYDSGNPPEFRILRLIGLPGILEKRNISRWSKKQVVLHGMIVRSNASSKTCLIHAGFDMGELLVGHFCREGGIPDHLW